MEERKRKRGETVPETKSYTFKVRDTEEEILAKKQRQEDDEGKTHKKKRMRVRDKKTNYGGQSIRKNSSSK
nr:hypothetical protein BaRGS_019167 [Batillaria attramentaria]